MNAEEAREIVERRRNGMEMMRDADQIILARGYLAALEGLEVKALVEAAEGYLGNGHEPTDSDTHQEQQCRQCRLEKALAAFRKAVKP